MMQESIVTCHHRNAQGHVVQKRVVRFVRRIGLIGYDEQYNYWYGRVKIKNRWITAVQRTERGAMPDKRHWEAYGHFDETGWWHQQWTFEPLECTIPKVF